MAFCPQCGNQIPDGSPVCPQCGAPLGAQPNQFQQPVNLNDHTAEYDPQDISDNKAFSIVAYLLGPIGIIIALLAAQKSPYTMFNVRQSIKMSVCEVLLTICCIVPFLGWLVAAVGMIIIFVLRIIMFFRVCGGKAMDVPIIGSFGFLK